MTNLKRTWSLPVLAGALTLLAACGGGGGGGGNSGGGGDPDVVFPDVDPPSANVTGLTEPSRTLSRDDAGALITDLVAGFQWAPTAVALQSLGSVVPTVGGAGVCAGGGTATVSGQAPAFTYTLSSCKVGDYTFSGTAFVQGDATSFRLDYDALSVQSGTTVLTAAADGATVCTVENATLKCKVEYPTGSLIGSENFVWGWDSTWASGEANGTHQCGCEATWNVTYVDFTADSGGAVIRGSNGTIYVARQSSTQFVAKGTIDGATYGPDELTIDLP